MRQIFFLLRTEPREGVVLGMDSTALRLGNKHCIEKPMSRKSHDKNPLGIIWGDPLDPY